MAVLCSVDFDAFSLILAWNFHFGFLGRCECDIYGFDKYVIRVLELLPCSSSRNKANFETFFDELMKSHDA